MLPPYEFIKKMHWSLKNLEVYLCEEISFLSSVSLPEVYITYADIFNEKADTTLPLHHRDLNHFINLKPSCTAPFSPLYNLSEYKLRVLKNYLDKNLNFSFIAHSKSSAGALILFIKKKDRSLRLCVNY